MNPLRIVRAFGLALIAVILLALFLAASTRAHAENVPDASTKKVAWVVTSNDFSNRFGTPQRLATAGDTCGMLEQIDLYRYDTPEHRATVDALIDKGTLAGASEDGSVWLSNEDVTLPTCTTSTPTSPPPATPIPTATPTAPVTATPSPTSSPTPPTSTPPVTPPISTAPPTTPSATSTSTPPALPTASATPTAMTHLKTGSGHGELAFTGSRSNRVLALIAVTAILLGVGLFLATRRKGEKRVDLDD